MLFPDTKILLSHFHEFLVARLGTFVSNPWAHALIWTITLILTSILQFGALSCWILFQFVLRWGLSLLLLLKVRTETSLCWTASFVLLQIVLMLVRTQPMAVEFNPVASANNCRTWIMQNKEYECTLENFMPSSSTTELNQLPIDWGAFCKIG